MPENTVAQLPWKAIAQAIRARIESDVRTRLLPKIAAGRYTVGDAVVALGQKLQAWQR